MESLVDVVDMIDDNLRYFKQKNPSRVRIYTGDKIFRDNEGFHKVNFEAELEIMGVEWGVSFPIEIAIKGKRVEVEAQDSEDIVIENENGRVVHSNHKQAMEELGLTFEIIDEWAVKYCLKG